MKISPVGTDLFHVDGRKDRHDEAGSVFHNFANAPKDALNALRKMFGYKTGAEENRIVTPILFNSRMFESSKLHRNIHKYEYLQLDSQMFS
jgi:hypothetical protein